MRCIVIELLAKIVKYKKSKLKNLLKTKKIIIES